MRFWLTTILLALLLYMLSAVDFVGLGFNPSVLANPGWVLLASFLSGAALSLALTNSHGPKSRVTLAVFLVHYGVTFLMTAVEAVYLVELRVVVVPLLVNGLITAAFFAPVAVSLHAHLTRWTPRDQQINHEIRAGALVWKLPLLAIVWMLLFVLAGALVFVPVARLVAPELLAGYTDLPAWVLPFHGARAVVWLLLALPMLQSLAGRRLERALILGTLFAALMGSNLLLPNPLLPAGLQLAHLVEVALANFIFGFAAGWLLLSSRPNRSSARTNEAAVTRISTSRS